MTQTPDELRRINHLTDVREMMSFKVNRRVMWGYLCEAGIYRQSFSIENAVMAFNEGRRSIGLQLLTDIMEACPEKWEAMRREATEEEENDRRRKHSSATEQ